MSATISIQSLKLFWCFIKNLKYIRIEAHLLCSLHWYVFVCMVRGASTEILVFCSEDCFSTRFAWFPGLLDSCWALTDMAISSPTSLFSVAQIVVTRPLFNPCFLGRVAVSGLLVASAMVPFHPIPSLCPCRQPSTVSLSGRSFKVKSPPCSSLQ